MAFGNNCLARLTCRCQCCSSDAGDVDQQVDVLLTLHIQLHADVIHVEEMADCCSISEQVSKATLCDDLAKGVEPNAEQQEG